jgi:hypothetical protein
MRVAPSRSAPAASGYLSKCEFSAPGAISPKAFPDLEVAVREIFA